MHPDRLDDDSALRPRSAATELPELSEEQRRVLAAVGRGSTVATLLEELELPADRLRAELLALLDLQLLEVAAKKPEAATVNAAQADASDGETDAAEGTDTDAPADSEKRVVQSSLGTHAERAPTPDAEREASPAIRPTPAIHLAPTQPPVQPVPNPTSNMQTAPGWSSSPLRSVSGGRVATLQGTPPADAPAAGQTLLGGFASAAASRSRSEDAPDATDASPPTRRGHSAPAPAAPDRDLANRARPEVRVDNPAIASEQVAPPGMAGRTLLGFRAPLEQIALYEQRRERLGETRPGGTLAGGTPPGGARSGDARPAAPGEAIGAGSVGGALEAFEVVDCLAQGGRGVVYLVRERHSGRQLALKVLRQDQCESEPAIAALTREARLLEAFEHPNLVRFEQFDREGEEPFLIMQYVEGLSGARLLHYPVPMPLDVGLMVVLDALEALFYVHDLRNVKVAPEGLVHADVSPENLLVGTDGTTRLIDFGSSCGPHEFANPQRVQAKLGYASPELLRGDEVDFRSDVFSIGAVLFHVLTKHPPFSADPAWREREHAVPKPSQLNPRVPKPLDAICQRALHPNPSKRFQSVQQLRQELERSLKSAGIECRRDRVGEWVQRVRQSLRGDVEFSPSELKELLDSETVALRRAPGTPRDASRPNPQRRDRVAQPSQTEATAEGVQESHASQTATATETARTDTPAPSSQMGAASRFAATRALDDGLLSSRARLWVTLLALGIAAGILYVALIEPQALNRWLPPATDALDAP